MSDLPAPQPGIWTRFTADPRNFGHTRASDADRDIAAQLINSSFSEGRLDAEEHSDRLGRALEAKQLGEFVPLLSDLPEASYPAAPAPQKPRHRNPTIMGWLGMAILFNLIWLFTWLPSGSPYYYWPMWPMLGTAIPAAITLMMPRSRALPAPEQTSQPEIDPGDIPH